MIMSLDWDVSSRTTVDITFSERRKAGLRAYEARGGDLGRHIGQLMQRIFMRYLPNDTPRDKIEINSWVITNIAEGNNEKGMLEAERQNPGGETELIVRACVNALASVERSK